MENQQEKKEQREQRSRDGQQQKKNDGNSVLARRGAIRAFALTYSPYGLDGLVRDVAQTRSVHLRTSGEARLRK
jgi:hypothetical protein